ncbi:MAG: hypothetical protein Q8O34_08990 [Rhodocyclaceae bacterium]|nr:hypothetical protein [Rhodocyclaceae bacterium]
MQKLLLTVVLSCLPLLARADVWSESYRLEALSRYADAAAQIENQVRNNEYAQIRHAWLLYLQGRFEDAIAGYKRAQAMNPRSIDASLGVTLPLMAQWRWQEAAEVARAVLSKAPGHYTATVRLLVAEEAMKQWRPMAEDAAQLAARYPTDATAWVYVARAEAWQNNVDRAREAYARVLQIVPGHIEATRYLAKK